MSFRKANTKLTLIRLIHTMIWLFFNIVLLFLFISAVTDNIGALTWVGIGLVFLEGLILLLFKMKCPLTLLARKYSISTKDNFDICLPEWLARYNKLIYTSFFVLILVLVAYRLLFQN